MSLLLPPLPPTFEAALLKEATCGFAAVAGAPLKVMFDTVTPPPSRTFCTSAPGDWRLSIDSWADSATGRIAAMIRGRECQRNMGVLFCIPKHRDGLHPVDRE